MFGFFKKKNINIQKTLAPCNHNIKHNISTETWKNIGKYKVFMYPSVYTEFCEKCGTVTKSEMISCGFEIDPNRVKETDLIF